MRLVPNILVDGVKFGGSIGPMLQQCRGRVPSLLCLCLIRCNGADLREDVLLTLETENVELPAALLKAIKYG